jgi:hypothetical protein
MLNGAKNMHGGVSAMIIDMYVSSPPGGPFAWS